MTPLPNRSYEYGLETSRGQLEARPEFLLVGT